MPEAACGYLYHVHDNFTVVISYWVALTCFNVTKLKLMSLATLALNFSINYKLTCTNNCVIHMQLQIHTLLKQLM